MNKSMYNLLIEPSKQDYYDLLDHASAECKYALFVIRDTIALNLQGQAVLEKLASFLYKEKQTDQWPGTKLFNRQARIFEYHYVPEFIDILRRAVPSLYKWLQPDLPEDLCLLREDKTPWLVTISHENDGYFVLSEQEKNRLLSSLPRYRFLMEQEDSGAS